MQYKDKTHFLEELEKALEYHALFESILYGKFQELLEKGPSKKELWEQTVHFMAGKGEKGYKGLSAKIKADNAPKNEKPKPPAPPSQAGEKNEHRVVKGAIKSKAVSFPTKEKTSDGRPVMGRRHINVQEHHHFVHDGKQWNHTHTTEHGEGLNARDK